MPILTFKHKGIKKLFEKGDKSGIQASMAKKDRTNLNDLDAASNAKDMNFSRIKLSPA